MSQIQDRLKVLSETAVIAGEESGLAAKNFFTSMPRWQKILFLACVVLVVPGYFGTYYGTKAIVASRLEKGLLEAHSAFAQVGDIEVGPVSILKVLPGQYAAFFRVTNPNLNLVAPSVPYTVDFYNAAGEKIHASQGSFFLLADQSKQVVIPRIDNREELTEAKLTLGEIKWQKRLTVPEVSFKTPAPDIYDQTSIIPPQLAVEGSVVNDSPYTIKKIRVTFLVYNRSGQIVGVNSRDEGNLIAFGRRAYKQFWPNLSAADVSKIEIAVDVNTLDPSNITYAPTQPVPVSDIPDLN